MPNLKNLDGIAFDSLAAISEWSKAWWVFAWAFLEDREECENNLDEIWAFVVRVTLHTKKMPPTDVADIILNSFDRNVVSQTIQRL